MRTKHRGIAIVYVGLLGAMLLAVPRSARAEAALPRLALGYYHTCALKQDGSVWCWGLSPDGQIGDGTFVGRPVPVQVSGLASGVVEISAGTHHTCARKSDGTLWCWGYNSNGQIGDGTVSDRPAPLQVTALGSAVAGVSCGGKDTCALKTDGTLWCWGENNFGQLGDGSTTDRHSPVQISGAPIPIAEISCGGRHTCVRSGAAAYCWGYNSSGALGDGTYTERHAPGVPVSIGPIAEITSGFLDFTCARFSSGAASCWGDNSDYQLGDGFIGVPTRNTPSSVYHLTDAAHLTADGGHACVQHSDLTVSCWGENDSGELGNAGTSNIAAPGTVASLGPVAEVVASINHTCARKDDGTVWCWGYDGSGQLGDGGTVNRNKPVQVVNFSVNVASPPPPPSVPAGGPMASAVTAVGLLLVALRAVAARPSV
jgi:alpha-tubulin suppressor-like RCC1 family protein